MAIECFAVLIAIVSPSGAETEKTGQTNFRNVVEAVKSLKATSAMLDGEIVIVDAQGRSSFQKLQRAMGKATTTGFAYEVFDPIYLDGYSLTQTPLKHRKGLLKNLVGSNSHGVIRYNEHIRLHCEESPRGMKPPAIVWVSPFARARACLPPSAADRSSVSRFRSAR